MISEHYSLQCFTLPLVLLVAAGDDSVYPGEVGRAQDLDELVRAGLQAGAGRLVLLSPADILLFHLSHGNMAG